MTDNDLAAMLNDTRALASDLHRNKCMVGPEGFTSHHPDCQTLRSLVSATDALRAERDALKTQVEAKAEEVREACALHLARVWYGLDGGVAALGTVACVRTTPLTSRPLADRIEELEAQKVDLKTMIQDLRERAEKAEAERDEAVAALRPWAADGDPESLSPEFIRALYERRERARVVLAKYPEGKR